MTSSHVTPAQLTSARLPRLDVGLADLAGDHDLVLCDVWGVIHNGVRHHPAAVEALRRFRRGGGTVILITNAPAPRAQVARRLESLRVPPDAYDDIASSGDVTVGMIVAADCPPLLHIGPENELALYKEATRLGPRAPRLVDAADAELAICVGLDEVRETPDSYDEILQTLHARGLDLVCANPDIVVEVGDQLVFCAGAIAERYAVRGGTVVQAGKPYPAIYERAIAMGEAIRGATPKRRILAIGDAMATDMRGAHDQDIAGVFVTAGIHRGVLHAGRRGSTIDPASLERFLADHEARPLAAVPELAWRALPPK